MSNRVCTPLFLKADPQRTGTIVLEIHPARRASIISCDDTSMLLRYFSRILSLTLARDSIIEFLMLLASSIISTGISDTSIVSPISPLWRIAVMLIRSMIPSKDSSAPIGICIAIAFAPSFSFIWLTTSRKSDPTLSILLTKATRLTLYSLASLQFVSDWGSTPSTAENRNTSPSSTLRDLFTSTVKSTWPGVSMILIWFLFHSQVIAAEVIVIPRSRSCFMWSMVVVPSCTSPILWLTPV